MLLLDRYILLRFFTNFVMLFMLVFVFAAAIDVILNLDHFVDAARAAAGEDSGTGSYLLQLFALSADYQVPRFFQFYAYLHGLAAVGAMAFTLAQMHRYRELVAVMASGVSLHRIAMPFLFAVFGLSVLQLLNQELLLPRVAPLLLRDYDEIGERGITSFEVRFTPDGRGSLFQAPSYEANAMRMIAPTILERDAQGRTVRRITANAAAWSEARRAWMLERGTALRPHSGEGGTQSAQPGGNIFAQEKVEAFESDLTPQVLMVRRFDQFASMLSLDQISQMLKMPSVSKRASDQLLRFRYSRFSFVLVNLLVLALTLPTFLLREPANLLRQSVLCAALAVPAIVGSAIGMMVDLPGIPPALGVFLPVIVLGFMSLFPWTFFKT